MNHAEPVQPGFGTLQFVPNFTQRPKLDPTAFKSHINVINVLLFHLSYSNRYHKQADCVTAIG